MSKTVFVGMSGGVDSSVAALRLKNAGYDVVGVFIKVWQPDFLICNWEQERLDAMRVAARLEIPFLTCDAESAYKKQVGEYFVSEYLAGRTPNPDVMCNQYVKFGAFMEFAFARGADFIATGHYAQIANLPSGLTLIRGADHNKDQSYFLWTLRREHLDKILFPTGNSQKQQIRTEAIRADLPTAVKKDSQGICFLGHVDIKEFMSHFTDLQSGDVLDLAGNVVGKHEGALVYTLGQRHGFTVNAQKENETAHYVVGRDLDKNVIIVDQQPPILEVESSIQLQKLHWIRQPSKDEILTAQFRYRQEPFSVELIQNEDYYAVKPLQSVPKPASGQSCVFYSQNECLGGGIIV